MTIKDLKELIKDLEDELEVSLTIDDKCFIKACICSSGLEEIEFNSGDEIVFVISPCKSAMEEILMEEAEEKLFEINQN